MTWYEKHRERLEARYPGEYIAIEGSVVLDHDQDFARLAERVFASTGGRSIYMPRVGAASEPYRVRSPRVRRP
jgi:hypothetical protein